MLPPHSTISVRVPAIAWLANDTVSYISWSSSQRAVGTTVRWPEYTTLLDRRSDNSPSIAGSGSGTVMAWKGSQDDTIRFALLNQPAADPLPGDLYEWGPPLVADHFHTPTFPTLVQYGTRLFMFWKTGVHWDGHLGWSELRDGRWVRPLDPNDGFVTMDWVDAYQGVALAHHSHDGRLYMAWRKEDSTRIWWDTFDGSFWGGFGHTLTDRATPAVPSLASDGNNVYMAYRRESDDCLEWSVLVGSTWGAPQPLFDRRSATGPTLWALGPGKLVMIWGGVHGDMWWSQFENGRWGPQQGFADRRLGRGFRANLA